LYVTKPEPKFPIAISGVAFDLDGTLLDTLPDIAEAGNRMLMDLGRAAVSLDTVRGFVGNGIPKLTKRLLTGELDGEPPSELFDRALGRFEAHYRDTLTLQTRPFPEVESGLARFAELGLPLACVTNKAELFTLPLLEATGLRRFFDLVVSGDSLPRKKPDPLPLLHCAQQFGIRPDVLLVIGDSTSDAQAARAAGCPLFCVPYGYTRRGVRDLNCDVIVTGLLQASTLVTPVV
jgi:phosphoglycolate phosphatase